MTRIRPCTASRSPNRYRLLLLGNVCQYFLKLLSFLWDRAEIADPIKASVQTNRKVTKFLICIVFISVTILPAYDRTFILPPIIYYYGGTKGPCWWQHSASWLIGWIIFTTLNIFTLYFSEYRLFFSAYSFYKSAIIFYITFFCSKDRNLN